MAKVRIENTAPGQFDLHWGGVEVAKIPCAKQEDGKPKINGFALIDEKTLDEMLAKDTWTAGLFSEGKLVDTRGAKSAAAKSAAADPAKDDAKK